MIWLLLIVYCVGAVCSVRPIARVFADENDDDDLSMVALNGMMGLLCATVWPLILGGLWVGRSLTKPKRAPSESPVNQAKETEQ